MSIIRRLGIFARENQSEHRTSFSKDWDLHQHLQDAGYTRRQRPDKHSMRKGGVHLQDVAPNPAHEVHRYYHPTPVDGPTHRRLHERLINSGFTHKTGRKPGVHHYSAAHAHVTVAPRKAGGHHVRFRHGR